MERENATGKMFSENVALILLTQRNSSTRFQRHIHSNKNMFLQFIHRSKDIFQVNLHVFSSKTLPVYRIYRMIVVAYTHYINLHFSKE